MATWKESKDWADQFIPDIKRILGNVCIVEASVDKDRAENTDLLFKIFGRRFAVRIRKIQERLEYNRRNEWTIRIRRRENTDVELSKLLVGWGHYCLYGWGDESTKLVPAWTIFDLNEVRRWLVFYVLKHGKLPGQEQEVKGANFIAICIDEMPKGAIVDRHTVLPGDPEENSTRRNR